jgi:serine/threonine-protein kinase
MQLILGGVGGQGGAYLPLKLLGQGGFGAAFLARDRNMRSLRQCVVKQFQPSGNLSPAQLQVAHDLFEREGDVLESLGNAHPQIPDIYAFFEMTVSGLQPGKQDKFFYLVQEFIDGQTMEEELAQKGQFSNDEVTELLESLLPVLNFIHDNGSIHRDIKPSNIMRHRNGRFYLLDFGAVKQATKGGVAARSTGIYSQGFAPPEQVSGSEVYPSTDLYALAVTCIMLLTGKQPNELLDSYSNTWKWQNHVAKVGNPLARVLDRMLLPTPSERFQSATEVLAALKQPPAPVASGRAVVSPSPPPTIPSQSVAQPPAPVTPVAKPVQQRSAVSPFSTLELLGAAAFTGFEGGLLAIALVSLLGTWLLSTGFWILLLAGLVFAQSRRIIERVDLFVIATLTLGAVMFFAPLRRVIVTAGVGGNPLTAILAIALVGGLLAVSITALFRLIYKLISSFL